MGIQSFGTLPEGRVDEIVLANDAGASVSVLTYGAVIRDLVVPGQTGLQRVVLGLDRIEDYVAHSPYFGAVVGRYANRIAGARFAQGERIFRLDANEKGNQLHGGSRGFGQRLWSIAHHDAASVCLVLVSEDGDMGYPGRLVATCTYRLREPATLRIELEATCDAPCPVNLTTHSYFNLDGGTDICSHHLMIAGDFVTPTTPDLIPTGEIRSVDGTDFDFRHLRPIGAAQLLRCRTTYDINYVLRHAPGELAHAATLLSRRSGVALDLRTTEPGLQFYDGHMLEIPVPGLGGAHYGPRAGLCLEPQRFPDGPNRSHFPPSLLMPGVVSSQVSELRFGIV
jgi:aldose 1-epimerase